MNHPLFPMAELEMAAGVWGFVLVWAVVLGFVLLAYKVIRS